MRKFIPESTSRSPLPADLVPIARNTQIDKGLKAVQVFGS